VIASAALGLTALGEAGYGELLGASLALGAGVDQNRERAAMWLDYAAEEIEDGAEPVLAEAGVARASILRLISAELQSGKAGGGEIVLASNDAAATEAGDPPAEAAATADEPAGGATAAPAKTMDTPVAEGDAPTEAVATAATDQPVAEAGAGAAATTSDAPVTVAKVEPSGGATAAPTKSRREEAAAFFEREMAAQAAQIDGLVGTLATTKDELAKTCRTELGGLMAPPAGTAPPAAGMMTRFCRSWAYATGDKAAMYWFDRALADAGDGDAESRLLMHLSLGHDRMAAAQ
jgi:hypothetical protein